jgi:hypothetical protein
MGVRPTRTQVRKWLKEHQQDVRFVENDRELMREFIKWCVDEINAGKQEVGDAKNN